jgi:thiamine kinase-like enzyme
MPPGHNLGGVNGEGVQDRYMDDHRTQHVNTTTGFEDFQFSVEKHPPSPSWISFLRSLMPRAPEGSVFTHGDVRPANITVKPDENGRFVVSGIIDWETSGFYPDYFESAQMLYLFDRNAENDWYQYVPPCIAPARHPERFLVARVWDHDLGFSAVVREKYFTSAP